jgi:membrane protein
MPNTRVKFKSALIAGIIAGTIFQVVQAGYIYFQVGVSKYNAIYGSFAAFPLFLIFLQIAWMIVLFGAEISYAHQNVTRYEFEEDIKSLSQRDKWLACLSVLHAIIKAFEEGKKPLTPINITVHFRSPLQLVNQLIEELLESGLIIETSENEERAFVPATDIQKMDIDYVLRAMSDHGTGKILIEREEPLASFINKLEVMYSERKSSKANILLKDI